MYPDAARWQLGIAKTESLAEAIPVGAIRNAPEEPVTGINRREQVSDYGVGNSHIKGGLSPPEWPNREAGR